MRCSIAWLIPPALLDELARRAAGEERDALLRTPPRAARERDVDAPLRALIDRLERADAPEARRS